MKRYLTVSLILLVILAVDSAFLYAQGRDRLSLNGKDSFLNLSDEQHSAIKRIKTVYSKKILQLTSDLMGKKHEFKGLISDPTASEEAIRNKGREIETLSSQITREMIEYELSVRKVLTTEQIRALSNIESSPLIRRSSGR